jgi:hypothetical protein
MENLSKYDAVLVCDWNDMVMEYDDRAHTSRVIGDYGYETFPRNYDDPNLYAGNAFGRQMQSDLNNWRQVYSAKVSDFGKWVVVDVSFHHHVTGRTASKTFLVVFTGGPKGTEKGTGIVLSTANKWRSISGASQAASYIKSACGALEQSTSSKL